MTVHEKLMKVQSKLKAPKNQTNTFGKYKYRNQEDILEALKPILAEVKATNTISDEIVLIGERYYIKAVATFTDVETNEFVQVNGWAREEADKKGMDASQLTGSTSSYARKYALNGLYGIDDTKDSDSLNKGENEEKATKEQVDQLNNLYRETKLKVLEYYKIKDFNELSTDIASELIARKTGPQ